MESMLLTPDEKAKVFEDYPCLDPSFEDDYKTEVELLLEAQLKKVMTDAPWKITTIGGERSVPNKTQIRFLFEDEYQALLKEAT